MFRINLQVASEAVMTAGDGVPGGTSGVLFIDSADGGKMKTIFPNGEVVIGEVVQGKLVFVSTNP